MKVFKIGGGVLKTSEDAFQLLNVLNRYKGEKLIIVISALNKITSKFEKLLNTYFFENRFDKEIFHTIKSYHINFAKEIFVIKDFKSVSEKLVAVFDEIEIIFKKKISKNYHYEYDQIVSYGEVLSSILIFEFLKSQKIDCCFEDIRKIILTDSAYSEATVIWDKTINNIKKYCVSKKHQICITQGFIAANKENKTTTLGREGSDFTASVLAYATDAEEVVFWKEVDGIYNADPAKTSDFVLLPRLSYRESLEQAFYGAKILHPKTIKPLQNKKIPIYVKSFFKIDNPGTKITDISKFSKNFYPEKPIYIIEENQILISISTRDFSFISEDNLGKIFIKLSKHRIKMNLMQSSAISFSVSVTNDPFKIPDFIKELKTDFKVLYNDNLELITIRHYTDDAVNKIITNREIILRQLSRRTARYLLK